MAKTTTTKTVKKDKVMIEIYLDEYKADEFYDFLSNKRIEFDQLGEGCFVFNLAGLCEKGTKLDDETVDYLLWLKEDTF